MAELPSSAFATGVVTGSGTSDASIIGHKEMSDQREGEPCRASVDMYVRRHDGRIVAALCVYAAIRILFFAAVFPLFNNVDEQFHFLSIVGLAHGHLPEKDLPPIDADSAKFIARYSSAEYLTPMDTLRRYHLDGPLSQRPVEFEDALREAVRHRRNFEAQAPPLYYAVASAWYNLGTLAGMRDWRIAYWIRFLNPIAYALLVWLSYRFVRRVYPENRFVTLAVPALIAVFPQDVFFGMNRDIFSPPLTAATLLLMMEALHSGRTQYRYLFAGSFLVGLTFLVNVSNCVLYAVLAPALWMWVRRSDETNGRKIWISIGSALTALVPPAIWMLRNYVVMGDLTGSGAKMHYLGWTRKPLSDILDHPLFSLDGLAYFLRENTRTFWRGEYVWHGVPMRSVTADWFYVLSSFLLVLIFLIHFLSQRRTVSTAQKVAGFQALSLVLTSLLFMAVISLLFDFHECYYPSRLHPFFVSGRIVSGALLPFAFMYVTAFELVLTPLRRWIHPAVAFAAIMLLITISEVIVRYPAFSSASNFFALAAHS